MIKLRQFVRNNETRMIWALVTVSVLVLVALFAFSIRRYGWGWTGFLSYTTPKSDTEEFQSGKTLWDVLDLIIVPAVLAVLVAVFRRAESNKAAMREELDREFELDRQKETALQAYLNQMKDLLLEEHLLKSEPEDEARALARTLTMTTMRRLDGGRNETLLNFLLEARVIMPRGQTALMNFQGANLARISLNESVLPSIDLSRTNLEGANLEGANLEGANLSRASLKGACLRKADLEKVFLFEANLEGANLEGASLEAADLQGASLNKIVLKRAKLRGAILSWASLEGANLERAYLRGANLEGANLEGANLEGANLEGANLEGARYDYNTKWPEDYDLKEIGITLPDQMTKKRVSIRQREIPAGVVEISAGKDTSWRISGFVVNESGYVISDFNVFQEGQQVIVDLASEFRRLPAEVIAKSPDALLTLLKLPESEGPYRALELSLSFSIGDLVYKASLISGIAEGFISGLEGASKFVVDHQSVIVHDIISVEDTLYQAGYGGSPLLNEQNAVIGVIIAASREPERYLAVASHRILSEFPGVMGYIEDTGKINQL